jgi:hypothetical protein
LGPTVPKGSAPLSNILFPLSPASNLTNFLFQTNWLPANHPQIKQNNFLWHSWETPEFFFEFSKTQANHEQVNSNVTSKSTEGIIEKVKQVAYPRVPRPPSQYKYSHFWERRKIFIGIQTSGKHLQHQKKESIL